MSKLEICNREFITNKNRLISGKNLIYLSSGNNASVYKHNLPTGDEAVKVFFDDKKTSGLKYDTYKSMRKLELERIVTSQEALYKPDYRKKKDIEGYTMSLLDQDSKANVLYFPSSKVLESFHLMEEDAVECGKHGILMADTGLHNAILTSNEEIWLCDIDWYEKVRFCFSDKKRIIRLNRQGVDSLFISLFISGISASKDLYVFDKEKLAEEVNEDYHGFLEELEKVDKPIEYFKKISY